jgi:hypothetical protein
MRVGSLVKWRYSGDKLFIIVTMTRNPFGEISVVSVRGGKEYNMFISDLELVCK